MSEIFVTGLGQHSGAGQNVEAFRARLNSSEMPLLKREFVSTQKGPVEVAVMPSPEVLLPDDLPEAVKRRMARLSKMCFATAREALEDAFSDPRATLAAAPERVGLIVGTAFGCIEVANIYQRRVILEGPTGASPTLFAASIHNSLAAQLSISFGIQGPNSTVATMEQTVFGAWRLAWDWLQRGQVDHVLVVLGDELSEYQPYVVAHLPRDPGAKFDPLSDACTVVPGEGVASVVLSRAEAPTPTRRRYARVRDVHPWRASPPRTERHFAALYGREGQASVLKNWLTPTGRAPLCHSEKYGSLVTGAAFELVAAALKVQEDGRSTACVQMAEDVGQAVILESAHP